MTKNQFTAVSAERASQIVAEAGVNLETLSPFERKRLIRISTGFDEERAGLAARYNKDLFDIQQRFQRDCLDLAADIQKRQQQGGVE